MAIRALGPLGQLENVLGYGANICRAHGIQRQIRNLGTRNIVARPDRNQMQWAETKWWADIIYSAPICL